MQAPVCWWWATACDSCASKLELAATTQPLPQYAAASRPVLTLSIAAFPLFGLFNS
jgi:hypothetical protein